MFEIDPFNLAWWAFMAIVFLLVALFWRLLKDKGNSDKRRILLIICFGNIAFLFFHKFILVELYASDGYGI